MIFEGNSFAGRARQRHGTTTLFAALDYATGHILHDHHQAHTHAEWLSFLRKIDRSVPEGVGIHIARSTSVPKPLDLIGPMSAPNRLI